MRVGVLGFGVVDEVLLRGMLRDQRVLRELARKVGEWKEVRFSFCFRWKCK